MKIAILFFLCTVTWNVEAMEKVTTLIDELIQKDNYAISLWGPRGLNPSPPDVILSLEIVTNDFLKSLKHIHLQEQLSAGEKREKVQTLVDNLPWQEFDTEEREFLADTIAPAIESMGFHPWSII